jgi:hypothetical protein
MFPSAFPVTPIPSTFLTNLKYEGWRVKSKNLFFANGIRKQPYMIKVGAKR